MTQKQIQKGVSPSFNLLEISSHLEQLGYSEKSLHLIENCGNFVHGKVIIGSCGCGTESKTMKLRCNTRFCPECAKKRRRRLRRRFLPFLRKFHNTHTYQFRFLTISPKNYKNLKHGLNHIRKSFSKFIRRKYIRDRVKGGFYIIEVTNKGNDWNIHLHCILYSRHLDNIYRGKCSCGQTYLKFDRLSKKFYCANRNCNKLFSGFINEPRLHSEWEASSGRPCHSIDISRISKRSSVLNYCLKYVTLEKDSFSSPEIFAQYVVDTFKRRLITGFGDFHNPDLPSLPPICTKCGEIIKFTFETFTDFSSTIIYYDPPPF